MAKQEKTNAMRQLDRAKIPYEALYYPSGGQPLDAQAVAALLAVPPQTVFKTLVLQDSAGLCHVCVIPGPAELDLKAAAAAFMVKSLRMLHVDELKPLTGYVRGGCSPIGMKKAFPTVVEAKAKNQPYILVSAGKIGLQLKLRPDDVIKAAGAGYGEIGR